jgi:hypothetical protein
MTIRGSRRTTREEIIPGLWNDGVSCGVRVSPLAYRAGVTLAVDEYSVGALGTDAPNEPFRVAVRPRRLWGSPDHVDAFGGKHRVEGTGELRVSVADQKPER